MVTGPDPGVCATEVMRVGLTEDNPEVLIDYTIHPVKIKVKYLLLQP